MSKAIDDVVAERTRQVEAEGWTEAHDDSHLDGDLALAGASYTLHAVGANPNARKGLFPPAPYWPWDWEWWNPKNPRRDLVRAAALLIAEIERLDRAALETTNASLRGAEPALSAERPSRSES